MASELEINEMIVALEANYHREASPARIDVFCKHLSDLPGDALKAAARQHMLDNKWFPTVAELRQAASRYISRAAEESRSTDAWQRAMALLSANLRGEIDDKALEADPAWKWYQHREAQPHPAGCECKYCQGYTEAQLAASLAELEASDVFEFGEALNVP